MKNKVESRVTEIHGQATVASLSPLCCVLFVSAAAGKREGERERCLLGGASKKRKKW